MKNITLLTIVLVLVLAAGSGFAQTLAEIVVGKHGGVVSWERSPASLDMKANHNYEFTTYSWKMDKEVTVSGTWYLDGKTIVLVDESGRISNLYYNLGTWYMTNEKGYSCTARFFQHKDVKELWAAYKGSGC